MELTSGFVQTGAFNTHYLEAGRGSPLILIHGGGAGADSRGNWNATIARFAEHYRVLAMDMVGFGESDAPAPESFAYTQAARNEQLVRFVEALDVAGAAVIGNSMGGATAMGAAMARPELIGKLVLMGTAGGPKVERDPAPVASIQKYDFTLEGMRTIVSVLAHPGFTLPEETIRYRYELSLKPPQRKAYAATMAWVGKNGLNYPTEKLAGISHETLVLGGRDDLIIPLESNLQLL
jgi:2-hydroxy-6-oxo-6-(2'-aminophenyl)hexa-2,4-dienoate hydrolase